MEKFHSGELEVQERAGVREIAEHVGGMIRPEITGIAASFLETQSYVIAASLDSGKRPWASILFGAPGFMKAPDARTVEIRTPLISGDPLEKNLIEDAPMGLLVIDLELRRRVKIKGNIVSKDPIQIKTERVNAQCPKYIQSRSLKGAVSHPSKSSGASEVRKNLTSLQQQWITSADTFFIATFHPQTGADPSHRGGMPGFVEVVSDSLLRFPDYSGNNMFNTIGNITANPPTGLLFLDFETGRTLQMTGRAEIIWDETEKQKFNDAERIVSFKIEEVVEIQEALPLRWDFQDYSPFSPNPARTSEKS